jgi:branched-subunit amino acid aminotransferase/4-amino-4-deoxychorismate lyase
MLAVDGRIAFLSLHRERLLRGAGRLGIDVAPADVDTVLERLPEEGTYSLRLTLSRGGGRRGYLPEPGQAPRLRLAVTPLARDYRKALPPVSMIVSGVCLAEQPALAGMKHCNRLEQVLAATEADRLGADEALMLNGSGSVQCAISANIFILQGRELLTPPCDRAGIAGTRRRLLLEGLAARAGFAAREITVTLDDCLGADALLLTNALAGIRAVGRLRGRIFDPAQDGVHALQRAYAEAIDECVAA